MNNTALKSYVENQIQLEERVEEFAQTFVNEFGEGRFESVEVITGVMYIVSIDQGMSRTHYIALTWLLIEDWVKVYRGRVEDSSE